MPIACTLTPFQFAARRAWVARLSPQARRGDTFIFTRSGETERQLRELVAAEAKCCPFLRMALRDDDDSGTLELTITGPAEAAPVIDALFT